MKISDLFENFFTRYNKGRKNLRENFVSEYSLRERVEDKLYSEKDLSNKNIDYDFLEDRIETELVKRGITEKKRLEDETKKILYIYAEDDSVKYNDIFNKVVPLAAKYLSMQPHFTLSNIDSLETLVEKVREGLNVYKDRKSFYGHYVDLPPGEGKLLLELDKKLHNDPFKPHGIKFTHFIIKLEDALGEPLNVSEAGNLINIYTKDARLNYDNFFNKFVPEAKKYLSLKNKTLENFNSYEDFKKDYKKYF